jgi:S1-C subfamily serine protease
MVTSEIIQQVFSLRSEFGSGTGFTVRVDDRQYLVTARHVLDGEGDAPIPQQSSLEVHRAGKWWSFPFRLVCSTKDPSDIAVVALPQALANFPEIELGTKGLVYGQEVYFLGFPYGRQGSVGAVNNGFPLPYVKRAIVSMLELPSNPMLVLDGINNLGFSGGPVAFRSPAGKWQIAAVISGFNSVREAVFKANSDEPANYTVDQNTGLIDATPLESVVALIRANPIGLPL